MTITHLEAVLKNGTVLNYVPEVPRQLYQVKWDHEIPDSLAERYGVTSFTDRKDNTPMVFRPTPYNKVLLTERLQRLWKGNIDFEGAGLTADQRDHVWRWMTSSDRAYTNGVGPDIYRDYILGLRLSASLPGMYPLITGGAVYAGVERYYSGAWRLELDHIPETGIVPGVDATFPGGASAVTHLTHPWLVHYAVNSVKRKLDDGTYLVNPWTTDIWNEGRCAPVPLIAREPIYFPLELMKKLPIGSPIPSPYNPPR